MSYIREICIVIIKLERPAQVVNKETSKRTEKEKKENKLYMLFHERVSQYSANV